TKKPAGAGRSSGLSLEAAREGLGSSCERAALPEPRRCSAAAEGFLGRAPDGHFQRRLFVVRFTVERLRRASRLVGGWRSGVEHSCLWIRRGARRGVRRQRTGLRQASEFLQTGLDANETTKASFELGVQVVVVGADVALQAVQGLANVLHVGECIDG